MTVIRLAALAIAVALSGAANASQLADSTHGNSANSASHAQAWNLTKLRTHNVKYHKRNKLRQRHYEARLRAHLRKRYWGSWNASYDRFDGFAFHGDGFRTSGKYQ